MLSAEEHAGGCAAWSGTPVTHLLPSLWGALRSHHERSKGRQLAAFGVQL